MEKPFPSWNHEAAKAAARNGRYGTSNVNRAVYRNNCEIFHAGTYRTASGKIVSLPADDLMLAATKVVVGPFPANDTPQLAGITRTGVINRDSMLVAKDLIDTGMNPAVLNLASGYHAGGGYHKGSNAQEESLCRVSTLSRSLYQYFDPKLAEDSNVPFVRNVYPMHKRYGGIYSPGVTVFRDASNCFALLEETFNVAVISVAALNFREDTSYINEDLVFRAPDGGFTAEGEAVMRDKIHTIFRLALAGGHDSLVLGAFGCGAFRLRPDRVAPLFKQTLEEVEFKNRFREVRFAILEPFFPFSTGAMGKFKAFYSLFA